MAVISDTFGGLHLTGEDAKKFRNQTRSRIKNPAGAAATANGIALAEKLLQDGFVNVAK